MPTMHLEIDGAGIATLCFDAPDAPVNTMTVAWQRELIEAVERLHRDKERVRGVLLTSAKTSFFAGAPLKHLLTLRPEDAAAGFREIEALKHAYRRLETLGRPVVALLDGAALGGGWELALAAHARFARDDEHIRFGMPEVTLGLIPGASGIVKTVRLLGLLKAQPYLVDGRLFGPHEAAELGLVQGLAGDAADLRAQGLAWIAAHPDAAQPWDRPGYRLPGGEPSSPKLAAAIAMAPAQLAAKTHGLYPAPQAVLEVMVEGALVDVDTALRIESRKLAKIMVGQNAKNMITAFFFHRNAVKATWGRTDLREAQALFVARLSGALRAEAAAMLGEGVVPAWVKHAAAGAGFTLALLDDNASALAVSRPAAVDADELKQRLLYRGAVEAARCLAEGVVAGAPEANIASIFACGFPAWAGGAIQFIAAEGLPRFEVVAAALAQRHGPRFALDPTVHDAIRRAATA